MGNIRYCEQCGSPLTPGSIFCENCGARVAAERAVPGDTSQRGGGKSRPQGRTASGQNRPQGRDTNDRSRPQSGIIGGQNTSDRNRLQGGTASGQNQPQGRDTNDRSRSQSGTASGQNQPQGRNTNDRSRPQGGNTSGQSRPQRQNAGIQNRTPGKGGNYPQEYPYGNTPPRRQYRQENLEKDWQQSWERQMPEEDEGGMTPIQYVLIGLTAVLLVALITFGAFWILGRSRDRDSGSRVQDQSETQRTESAQQAQEDPIAILDEAGNQSGAQDTDTDQSETQQQSETQKQTEAPAADIELNYQEFTVTLPGSWQGKYGITQGVDYYTFYQQASKAKGYNGTLFTVSRYTDLSYKDLPNYEVLGTGNGAAFVFRLPTDVQYAPDDGVVSQEYQTLASDIDTIKGNIKILVSGEGPVETEPIQILNQTDPPAQDPPAQQSSGSGYISDSSQRALGESDVAGMSYDDMQMAINEIYARHGRKFANQDIQSYFDSQPWYQGTVEPEAFDESVFSSTESQNIQYLLEQMGLQ